jgi:hypothetical protein
MKNLILLFVFVITTFSTQAQSFNSCVIDFYEENKKESHEFDFKLEIAVGYTHWYITGAGVVQHYKKVDNTPPFMDADGDLNCFAIRDDGVLARIIYNQNRPFLIIDLYESKKTLNYMVESKNIENNNY